MRVPHRLLICVAFGALALAGSVPARALEAGITLDVHQDITNPELWPNDFHIEGLICSNNGTPPVVIDSINDIFGPNFTYTIHKVNPSDPADCWYWFEATWWLDPGMYIPYCTVLHLGVLFDVDAANVIIDLTGWWTRDGMPVGNMIGELRNQGYVPQLGFNVADTGTPQVVTIANGQPPLPLPPLPLPPPPTPPWPPAPMDLMVMQMDVVPFPPGMTPDFRELREFGQQQSWPWVPVVYSDGTPIAARPYYFAPDSFFDVFLESAAPATGFTVAMPVTIEPGGFLVARQRVMFVNNNGESEERWFWEIHGAQPPQACCFPDGHCEDLLPFLCQQQGGHPMGLGTVCATTICPTELGACCYGEVAILCVVTDQLTCVQQFHGQWMGSGTTCADLNGNGVADVCETTVELEACCLDGHCQMLMRIDCLNMGGEPMGPGTRCLGDHNENGIDDICETKWLQPPDLNTTGIDVNTSMPFILADDFLCTKRGLITEVMVWGSWLNDQLPMDPANVKFTLSIHADIPDPDGSGPGYSMPGNVLWVHPFPPGTFMVQPYQAGLQEGWMDPPAGYFWPGDTVCWLYYFSIPAAEAFCQEGNPEMPIVYWLDVQAQPIGGPVVAQFGWKTSVRHWNDDAVWGQGPDPYPGPWNELRYPPPHPMHPQSIDLAFALSGDEPCPSLLGACCYGQTAILCAVTDEISCRQLPNGVWMGPGTNCDDLNGNGIADICEPPPPVGACCYTDAVGDIRCVVTTLDDCVQNYLGVWMGPGTNCDDLNGNGIADICEPPPPVGACCYGSAALILCVVTDELSCLQLPNGTWMGPGTNCDDLNGNGIADICEPPPPVGACCYGDATLILCVVTNELSCLQLPNGVWMGPGTNCDDLNGNGIADICEPPPPLGACCYGQTVILCVVTDEISCRQLVNGTWMGPGTNCDDLNGNGIADICEPPPDVEACCLPNGQCLVLLPNDCLAAAGQPMGVGTRCFGDLNGNDIDDICEAKWLQPPDLSTRGIDVNATMPFVLADDFLCTQRTLVTDIVIFGSWLNDMLPGDPSNVRFTLSFHADIPDPDGQGPAYSMPGHVLWVHNFPPGSFFVRPYQSGLREGWMTPPDQYMFPGDTICWMYYFQVPLSEAFCQQGTMTHPVVYWLDVQAEPVAGPVVAQFGWKTSVTHWNDDAVWGHGMEPYQGPWAELRYPPEHPLHPQSIDLAFALGGDELCPPVPCPGDSNCDGLVSWRDIDYFVAAMSGQAAWKAMFLPGVPTCPYSNNDVNGDGVVNWRDIDPFVALMGTICP